MIVVIPRQSRWQRTWWSHPELSLAVVAAAAWFAVLTMHIAPARHFPALMPDDGMADHHQAMPNPAFSASVGLWVLMATAMMLPTALPAARLISLNGKWRRRQRGPALFAAGYLAVWSAVGVVLLAAARLLGPPLSDPPAVAGALLVAAVWGSTRWKRTCLLSCHRLPSLPPDGWRADKAAVREGIRNGLWCTGSCGPMMVPMALVPHASALWLMLFLSAVIWAEKLLTRTVNHLHVVAAVLTLAATVALIGTPFS
jgi:predicted metal-binding membrane protein